MLPADSEFWAKAQQARDKLIDQFMQLPSVRLIDIGTVNGKDLVLRIHVEKPRIQAKTEKHITFPEQIDDIPVIVMSGDYQLEENAPES